MNDSNCNPQPINVTVNADGVNSPAEAGLVPVFKENADAIQKNFSTTMNQDDIVNISVAEQEKKIQGVLSAAKKQLRAANDDLTAATKAHDDYLESWCQQNASGYKAEELMTALTAFGIGDLHLSYGVATFDKRAGRLSAELSIKPSSRYSSFSGVSRTVADTAPEAYLTLFRGVETAEENVKNAGLAVNKAESALFQVDTLERRAKASVARSMISQTEDGQKVIEHLDRVVDESDPDALIDSLGV